MPQSGSNDTTETTRRRLLKSSGAGAAAVTLAGCLGGGDDDEDTGNGNGTETGNGNGGMTETETDEVISTDTQTASTAEKTGDEIQSGGTLRYGLPEPPDTSNPFTSNSVYSSVATMFVNNALLGSDPVTYEYKPWVLDDWGIEKQESDKPEVVLSVRDGSDLEDPLLWNDGTEFTVEDVLFTYQYLNEHEPGALVTYQNYDWAEMDDSDEWDIRVKMAEPIGTWEQAILGLSVYPKHIWEDVGADYQSYTPHEEVDVGLTGLGPAVITEWRSDTSMEISFDPADSGRPDDWEYPLTKLDWYANHESLTGKGPHLDNVQYFVYGEKEAMNQALLQGDVDTVYETQQDTVEQLRDDDNFQIVQGPGSGFNYGNWNHRRPPLNDICLRQAMAFAWDEIYWVEQVKEGTVLDGNIPYTPGYTGVRPETVFGGELMDDPAVNAFNFRAESEESTEPDVQGIRSFLENGEIIDGTEGTYVGQDYPGSLSGVNSTYSDSQFDYSFGPAESSLLLDNGIEQELYVNGEPISQFYDHGETIEALLRPPGDNPDIGEAWFRWAENVRKLGIPMKIKPTAFNEIVNIVPYDADFDMHELGWGGQSSSGTSSYYFFHSDWTNETIGADGYSYNSSGYGNHDQYNNGTADDIIDEAWAEFDQDKRQELYATALERVYLDVGYMVYNFPIVNWPLPSWAGGAVDGLVDPPFSTLYTHIMNMYDDREQEE